MLGVLQMGKLFSGLLPLCSGLRQYHCVPSKTGSCSKRGLNPWEVTVARAKHVIDYSMIPSLNEEDLDEQFVKGHGPGGQAVNKTSNCVLLTHKPTGLQVKCHQSRSLVENRKIARTLLITKLDNSINGDKSVEAQTKLLEEKKERERNRRQKKLAEMKQKWKEREGIQ